jgi:hypothetical protein
MMKFFSRIAFALLLTFGSAFAEEVVVTDPTDTGIVPDLQTESESAAPVGDAASVELASSSEIATVSPAPWSETMSSYRAGYGTPEGTSTPNELHEINWSDDKLVIGAGALIVILLLIIIL